MLPPTATVDVPVRLAEPGEIDAAWARAAHPETVMLRGSAEYPPILRVEHDPEVGYRLQATGYGDHLVPPAGDALLSDLPDDTDWKRERLMVSQVMPLLSTLHGREILHAGAVIIDGRAIGIAARSGTGKSSTLAHLVALGARFHADDVIALEPDPAGPGLNALPGPGMINLDRAQLDAIAPEARGRLGEIVAETEKLHLTIPPGTRSYPLDALFHLERGETGPTGLARLLGSSYLTYGASPERMLRQFEVAARIDAHRAADPVHRHGGRARPSRAASSSGRLAVRVCLQAEQLRVLARRRAMSDSWSPSSMIRAGLEHVDAVGRRARWRSGGRSAPRCGRARAP